MTATPLSTDTSAAAGPPPSPTTAAGESDRTTAPPIITTRVTNALDALPPLTIGGTDAPVSSAGGNTLGSGLLTAEVVRPVVPSPTFGTLRLVPTNRSANLTAAVAATRVTIELTLSQPGMGAFVLDTAGSDSPLTVSRDAAQGLFTVSGPAGAVRDALPWLRFGFSRSAAGRNDTTVTVALTADGGPRQTMVVRVSDIAEINTAPKAWLGA